MATTFDDRTEHPRSRSYLIENAEPISASDRVDLHALARELSAEPDVTVTDIKELNVNRGAGQMHKIVTLVVEMRDEHVEQLKRKYGRRLAIEPNQDLNRLRDPSFE